MEKKQFGIVVGSTREVRNGVLNLHVVGSGCTNGFRTKQLPGT